MESIEAVSSEQNRLASEARKLKEEILDSRDMDKVYELNDLILAWDKKIKEQSVEKFGSTSFLQAVKGWQVMVGGSEEEEEGRLSDQQRKFFLDELKMFIEKLKEKFL